MATELVDWLSRTLGRSRGDFHQGRMDPVPVSVWLERVIDGARRAARGWNHDSSGASVRIAAARAQAARVAFEGFDFGVGQAASGDAVDA
jgi:hypothetical protein